MAPHVVLSSLEELSPVMESCIAQGSKVVLTVTGNSMYPLLCHRRDQVVLQKAEKASLQIGDVPLYRRANGQFVLHRIVDLGATSYTLCGDGQWRKEYGIPCSAVVAVATGFYRKGKYISCESCSYRLYVKLWIAMLPLRPFILKGRRFAARIVRKLRKPFTKKV